MNDSLPIIRYKLPEIKGISKKCLGRFASRLDYIKKEQYCIIYVDIKRIIEFCKESVELKIDLTFDQVFSHVFCHEYLHFVLLTYVGINETNSFDNLFGIMDDDPRYVYSGIKFEGDPIIYPKRHFYTKLINTIKNKVVCRCIKK